MTQTEFVAYLARQVKREGSLNKAASMWGISVQYLSDVLKYRRTPGPKMVEAVGYTVVVTRVYKRKNGAKNTDTTIAS